MAKAGVKFGFGKVWKQRSYQIGFYVRRNAYRKQKHMTQWSCLETSSLSRKLEISLTEIQLYLNLPIFST